ncbi:MAG: PIG-L deacetylase family protein [Candidatus Nanopelagicales bacterium]
MAYTVVFVHAHPDDEALLTSGTMADLALQGHRVVLVVATDGAAGLADVHASHRDLAAVRHAELEHSAQLLGAAAVHWLGYGDSGLNAEVLPQPDAPMPLVYAPREEVVARLAAILRDEAAAVVVGYDSNGGYGHPDHMAVHEIVYEAAAAANVPRILEATLPRDRLARLAHLVSWLRFFLREFDPTMFDDAFTSREAITCTVDVRHLAGVKRDSLRAHASQASGGSVPRTVALLLALPLWLYRRWFGSEYFVERGADAGATSIV